ncbi:MAG: FmdB family transcriptional regulator [Proteobacteria bacterium]|nr:MAG: FmdB family transcriptional regulator [Pseudomonadota bacterium]
MPTYEYRCRKCGASFEINESVAQHEDAQHRCPNCQSTEVESLLSDFYARTSKKS